MFLLVFSTIGQIVENKSIVLKERKCYSLQQVDAIHSQLFTSKEKVILDGIQDLCQLQALKPLIERLQDLYEKGRNFPSLLLGIPLENQNVEFQILDMFLHCFQSSWFKILKIQRHWTSSQDILLGLPLLETVLRFRQGYLFVFWNF